MTRSTLAATAALALAVPAAAQAHVTLQPKQAPAGQYVVQDVRVPNEKDDANTTKVVVQLPDGFAFASYAPVAGWKASVTTKQLDAPIDAGHGETSTTAVETVTWTATGKGVAPGQFVDLPLSIRMPDTPGRTLTFKALQTYSDGEVVRWIGAPDSEKPAATVELQPAADTQPAGAPAAAVAADTEDKDGTGLAIAALVVGALGLATGVAGLARGRRATT